MRAWFVAVLVSAAVLAGCSAKASHCPAEYGEDFDKAYHSVLDSLKQNNVPVPPDSDGDCINDAAETAMGTDPNNYDSHPTLQQLQDAGSAPKPIGGAPPTPQYMWDEKHVTGQYTTNTVADVTDSPRNFEVPANATEIWLNITLTGQVPSDSNVRFLPPDCNSSACWTEKTASGGSLQVNLETPDAGTWRLVIFAGLGVQQGTYDLGVNAHLPVAGAW